MKEVFKFSLVIKINLIFVYRTLFSPDPSAAGRRKIFDESSNLYGSGHSILYPASHSKNIDVLNALMEEECAISLVKEETKTKQWGNFVCNVCESGCTKLLKEIIQFNASTPDRVCRDENEATPLMR